MKDKPNINNLSTEPRFKVGDMVKFDHYLPVLREERGASEAHGIIVSVEGSLIRVRPLTDFTQITLCNAADCQIAAKE
jgi:hypothetical protein